MDEKATWMSKSGCYLWSPTFAVREPESFVSLENVGDHNNII